MAHCMQLRYPISTTLLQTTTHLCISPRSDSHATIGFKLSEMAYGVIIQTSSIYIPLGVIMISLFCCEHIVNTSQSLSCFLCDRFAEGIWWRGVDGIDAELPRTSPRCVLFPRNWCIARWKHGFACGGLPWIWANQLIDGHSSLQWQMMAFAKPSLAINGR